MATNNIILYGDQSEDVIFSGPAWPDALTNMQDPRQTNVARSTNATVDNTQFFMALSAAVPIAGIIITATNLSANAQYRITGYSDSGFTIQTFTTDVQDVFADGADLGDPDDKGLPLIALFDEEQTIQYYQVEIFDTGNTDNYVELGTLFMGITLNLTYNMSEGSAFSRDPNTTVQKALNGTPFFSRHKNIRTWTLTFPRETYEVGFDEIDVLNESSGLDRAIFVIPFPDDTARRFRQSFLGRLAKLSPLQMLMINDVSTGFEITEYLG